jgi:hypothetical protein
LLDCVIKEEKKHLGKTQDILHAGEQVVTQKRGKGKELKRNL